MRKINLILSLLSFCFFTLQNIQGQSLPKANLDQNSRSEMESASARARWEQMRLADPESGKIPHAMRAMELAYSSTLPSDAELAWKSDAMPSVNWAQMGPWNIGGRTRAFDIDIADTNHFVAGGVSAGIWNTTDGGQTWTKVTTASQHPGVNFIAQDKRPGHTQTWYALSGEAYGTSASGGDAFYLGNGMMKSTDNGITWNVIPSTVSGTPHVFDNVWDATWSLSLDISDTTQDVLYASTVGAILRSSNGGTSWGAVRGSTSSNLSYFTSVMTTPNGTVYATLSSEGTHPGIWRSDDGLTWTNINPGFMPAKYGRIVSGYVPQNENVVYFLLAATDSAGKVTYNFQGDPEWNSLFKYTYVSGNGSGAGGVWQDLSQNIPAPAGIFDQFVVQGGYDLLVKVKPDDSNTVIIGGTNLYRSTSAFQDSLNTKHIGGYGINAPRPTVTNILYPNQHPDQHILEFAPWNPNIVFSCNDGGIYKTTEVMDTFVDWTSLNDGYISSQFYTIALDHSSSNTNLVVGGLQDNGSWYTNSTSQTSPWAWTTGGDGSYCAIKNGGGLFYFSKQQGKMLKTMLDINGNVQGWERIDPIGGSNYLFINPFILDPNNQNRMYLAAGNRIWRNSDLSGISLNQNYDSISTNWMVFPDTIPGTGIQVTALAVSTNAPDLLYIGTNDKRIYKCYNPTSINPTLTYISSSSMPAGYVSCLAVHPEDHQTVLAVFSNYSVYSLWLTTDAGSTWSKCAGNLEATTSGSGAGPSLRWASIIPRPDGTVYLVGTSTGLYATNQLNGLSTVWVKQASNTLGDAIVDMIDYRLSDGKVVVATHGAGVWTGNITSAGGTVGITPTQPGNHYPEISLYPNPVTAGSKAIVTLPEKCELSLTLLDVRGRIIREITKGNREAGEHSFPIELENAAPGMYYLRMSAGGYSKTLPLTVGMNR